MARLMHKNCQTNKTIYK